MRRLAGLLALGALTLGGLLAAPLAAQSTPKVRNAPDFADVVKEYRKQRVQGTDGCCAFSAPVFDKTVSFRVFDTFEPVYEAQNDRQMILEFVPQGATVEDWSRMITLSAFKGAGAAPVSTADMQQRFFNTGKGCEVANLSRTIASGRLGDGTEYNLSSNGCGSTAAGGYPGAQSGRGEQFIALLLRDEQNIVVLQYAERGEGFAHDRPPITDDMVPAIMSRFRSIAFCRDKAATGDCSIAFGTP
ncbi:hypothetical protein [Blastomonas sp. AAP53]|uniref:hypothetical protein n=1 Tax=Blastomonas sp. AAP53 TaxID=1248760 RepID=UPI0002E4CEA9|nr:hypothetical protein [Blastomonas sp. AAP53]